MNAWGAIVSALGQIGGGIATYSLGLKSASLLKEQGTLSKDDYFRQAELVQDEGHRIRAKQTMEYISSGVEVVGTPQLVLRETLRESVKAANALRTTGINIEALAYKQAKIAKKEAIAGGISQMLGGVGSGISAWGKK